MKNILLLILSFIALPAWSQSVQYRPTAYTAPFVSTINSAAAAQTYLGIPSSTNNALLNGTNTFTGTNTFNGQVNTWRMNLLWQTNGIYLPTLSGAGSSYNGNCTSTPTNIIVNTPFETNLFTVTLPALSSTNSRVVFDYVVRRTNSLTSVANFGLSWTVGSNFVTITSIPFSTSPTFTNFLAFSSFGGGAGSEIFRNDGSMTVQQPIPAGNAALFSTPARSFISSSLIDSSSSWSLTAKIGWGSGAVNAATNLLIDRLVIYEVIPPHY